MDDAVRKALKKQRELQFEIDRLEQFIRTYEELSGSSIPRDEMSVPVTIGENSEKKSESSPSAVVRYANHPTKRRNNIKKLRDVCVRLIEEAKRPLTRTELAAGMERLNVKVHANDIPKYLGTLLWRNKDMFVSVGDGYLTKAMYQEHRRQEIAADHVGDTDDEIHDLL